MSPVAAFRESIISEQPEQSIVLRTEDVVEEREKLAALQQVQKALIINPGTRRQVACGVIVPQVGYITSST